MLMRENLTARHFFILLPPPSTTLQQQQGVQSETSMLSTPPPLQSPSTPTFSSSGRRKSEISKRHSIAANTEGSFSIIDRRAKESESSSCGSSFCDETATADHDNAFYCQYDDDDLSRRLPLRNRIDAGAGVDDGNHAPLHNTADEINHFYSTPPPFNAIESTSAGHGTMSTSVSAHNLPHMTTSCSRFKIVPVESKYKRGRWSCWDYYDHHETIKKAATTIPKAPTIATFTTTAHVMPHIEPLDKAHVDKLDQIKHNSTATSINSVTDSPKMNQRQQRETSAAAQSIIDQHHPRVVHFTIDGLSDSGDSTTATPEQCSPSRMPAISFASANSSSQTHDDSSQLTTATADDQHHRQLAMLTLPPCATTDHDTQTMLLSINTNNLLALNNNSVLNTPNAPVDLFTHGFQFERSLSTSSYAERSLLENLLPGSIPPVGSPNASDTWVNDSTGAQSVGGAPPMVAIDSKIEQAMDLVKTHLMFAVREEVEILRAKIVDLETTVLQLEAENAILREHVPADILQQLVSTAINSRAEK